MSARGGTTTSSSPDLVLWIDDERFALTNYKNLLERNGIRVDCAYTLSDGLGLLRDAGAGAKLAIVDIMLPVGDVLPNSTYAELAKGGYEAGAVLVTRAREWFPQLPLLVYTSTHDPTTIEWLKRQRVRYVSKMTQFETSARFLSLVRELMSSTDMPYRGVKSFIVHGHAAGAKWELKNYLQNTLRLPEPVVLHEQPSMGRTLIEKFEHEAADRNLVFVLLTPDDPIGALGARARQNVIFELGYFLGKLGRREGRVLVLYTSGVEIPSDLSGVVYIDITNGIEAAGEIIRRELRELVGV